MAEPKSNLLRSDPTLRKATHVVYGPSVPNEIRVIPCTTWRDFASSVGVTTAPMLGRVFRGQSDSKWRLQSKWDRYAVQQKEYCKSNLAIAGRHDTPDSFLERFKLNYIDPLGLDTSNASAPRAVNTKSYPCLARNPASSNPRPRLAPVIKATLLITILL